MAGSNEDASTASHGNRVQRTPAAAPAADPAAEAAELEAGGGAVIGAAEPDTVPADLGDGDPGDPVTRK